jgi:cytochrome c oxidase subunit III
MKAPLTEEEFKIQVKVKKNLMWIGIISIVMLFGGLTSAYVVASGKSDFVPVDVPPLFWISAVIIAISSISMIYATYSAKKGKYSGVSAGLLITLVLGIGFSWSQFGGWGQLVAQKIFFSGHSSGQYLYMLSGLHLAHLAGGLLSLVVMWFRSMKKAYTPSNYLGLEVGAMYWHFLGILWIYLLIFLHLVR